MKTFLIIVFSCFLSVTYAQKFEGKITIVKKTLSDTVYYSYSIKKNNVRVDEYDKYKRLQKSYIINLVDSSIFAINHNQKVYKEISSSPKQFDKNSVEIINTGIFKYINGYKCYQWRVRDVAKNTEVSYWVADENFDFYAPLAGIWTNVEDVFSYYMSLPLNSSVMPIVTEYRTLLRDEKARYTVIAVEPSVIKDSEFSVPITNYQVVR